MAVHSLFWLTVVAYAIYLTVSSIRSLRRNIELAKRSNLPYFVHPVHSHNLFTVIFIEPLLKLADHLIGLPSSGVSWRWLIRRSWAWDARLAPFATCGSDTLMTVAPGGCTVFIGDADVLNQVMTRRLDFPKPVEHYDAINLFGVNVVSTEGADWKRHRRLVGPAFGESTNRAVWNETLWRTRILAQKWVKLTQETGIVKTAQADATRLTLDVLGKVAFGLDMFESAEDKTGSKLTGESLKFAKSLGRLMNELFKVIVIPHWLLKRFPIKSYREAYQSFDDVQHFTGKILADKKAALYTTDRDEARSDDLVGRLVQSSAEGVARDEKSAAGPGNNSSDVERLSDSEILGNAFIFLFAGHDTTAATLYALLLFLALHPECQRRLQKALDVILQEASPDDYSSIVPKLLSDIYVNAVINEVLRVASPAPMIPKVVARDGGPQTVMLNNGQEATLAPGMLLKLNIASVHRNPKYWTHEVLDASGLPRTSWPPSNPSNDLEAFRPERWIQTVDTPEGPIETLVNPAPGAFIPFSDGARACLGKRFSIMETMAAVTAVFSQYSVELAPEDAFPGEDIGLASPTRRAEIWEALANQAFMTWKKKTAAFVTLQLRSGYIPMRFAKRGEENFS